ncbi:dipeptidyl peptidase 3 [Diorhabda carinulata]|uniref:dipeptidyl peptidase 3 n=1 Tax=Diorhabda carinulata TaxID=1163345 RepID=UPI0025A2D10D|nr:dipeptidyl peptidase 3 [Diorhabda carinulata]
MSNKNNSQYILPNDQPVVSLEVKSAFEGLTEKEKLYAHYISKASWHGGLITLLQTSPESGPIFVFLHKFLSAQPPTEFKSIALNSGFSEDEITALFVYACGVFTNAGNYKGFGDTKFIPNIEKQRLEALLKLSPIWSELEPLWKQFKDSLYDLENGKSCLGYGPSGITTYLSHNCTPKDNEKVQNWLKSEKIECYNTRLFKTVSADNKTTYEIRLASEEKKLLKTHTEGDTTYQITCGDYSPLIGQVAKDLQQAIEYAANENEVNMLKAYISSFKTGSLDDHKLGSRYWIKDKGPAVESYIGFIETYRDPAGVRGEFEGFVAVVNRAMSAKFSTLVSNAEKFLTLLPWNKGFEKDKFLKPDFTSLDVLTFAGSGIPAGINIPNYDEIRQSEGFKNVSLGNVIPASYQSAVTPFLTAEDAELFQKWRVPAFELQVGLHELLGHGSGKLLRKELDGTFNFPSTLLDPLTGKPPSSFYEPGDTYDTKFGPLSSSYEECRAEAVGLYLSLEPNVLKIFGHEGEQADIVTYVNWLSLVWAGAGKGLELWEPGRGWLQAHAQARFVLARVLIQAGVASVTQPTETDLLVTLDRSAIKGAGRIAIGQFLLQLQVYKATGDLEKAQALYNHYAEVKEPWLSWRSIVLANKQARKMFVQVNTSVEENAVKLKYYDASLEGLVQSWVERFSEPQSFYKALLDLSKADANHF